MEVPDVAVRYTMPMRMAVIAWQHGGLLLLACMRMPVCFAANRSQIASSQLRRLVCLQGVPK
jgi:hypothetical protein